MDVDTAPYLSFLPPEVNVLAVLQESVHGQVDLVQVAVLQVLEKKLTSRAVKELGVKLPAPTLSHLKRVRRIGNCGDDGDAEILREAKFGKEDAMVLYLDYLDNFDISYFEKYERDNINTLSTEYSVKVLNKLKEKNIDISLFKERVFVSRVAKYAPRVRKMYDMATVFWPCTFHEDSYLTQLSSSQFFNEEEIQGIVCYMNKAIKLGHIANTNGSPAFGTIIVDSEKGDIVGQGVDSRHKHPLQHSAMLAIDDVAHQQGGGAWSKKYVLSQSEDSDELPATGNGNSNSKLANDASSKDTCMNRKIVKDEAANIEEKNCNETICDVSAQDNMTSNPNTVQHISEGEDTNGDNSYICTGFDVYMSHEPCMMCAMALLHSRVRRIFYVCPRTEIGALGSITKLHTLPGINHRYEVFIVSEKKIETK